MRKKIKKDKKRKTISVSLHPELIILLKKYTILHKQNKSQIIEELLKNYFLLHENTTY